MSDANTFWPSILRSVNLVHIFSTPKSHYRNSQQLLMRGIQMTPVKYTLHFTGQAKTYIF